VSQLLDALRRAGRAGSARPQTDAVRSQPAAIFATMGRGAKARQRREWWIALLALSFVAVMAFAWSALRAGKGQPAPRLTDQAAVSLRRSPPPAPRNQAVAPVTSSAQSAKPAPIEARRQPPTPPSPVPGPQPAPREGRGSREFGRALALQRAGDLSAALATYRTLFDDPHLAAPARNNAGLIHQQRGELADAQSAFERAIEEWPAYARAHNNLGVVLLTAGRAQEAAVRFRQAAELDPRDPDPRVNLALAYKAEGRLEQAKEALLEALVLSPANAPAHYNLAVVYDHSGEHGRAVDHYRSFLEHSGAEHAARAADVRARIEALASGTLNRTR
jgi:Flp pilus assembly protein TadD